MFSTRKEAQQHGDKYYITGTPCKHGHLAPRATLSGTCTECTNQAAKDWAKRNKSKLVEYSQKYRDANREKVREADRVAHAKHRAENAITHRQYRKEHYAAKIAGSGRVVRPNNRLPLTDLIGRLQVAHNGSMQYVEGFSGLLSNAVFLCTTHAETFAAMPCNVLKGANPCPKCNHMKSSGEAEVARYLATFTNIVQRDRTLLKPKELDILMPEHSLAVEYCGMYWHSHFDVENERKNRHNHYQKYVGCAAQGVRLLTIYETEWEQRKPAIKRLLRNAVGKSRGKLMARKCELRIVTTAEARMFYDKYHPQGGEGSGDHYALFWKNKMVACMRFVLGANDRGVGASARTWTLGRYATRVTVAGGASRLFRAFLADKNPPEVKSFSDNRYFSGGMYEQLGFKLEEEVPPDYQVWSPKLGLLPKSHYQRRNISRKLTAHGMEGTEFDPKADTRTEREMTFLMGAGRIYDCGKKRWVWTKTN